MPIWPAIGQDDELRGLFVLGNHCLVPGDYRVAFGAYSEDLTLCYSMTDVRVSFSVCSSSRPGVNFIIPAIGQYSMQDTKAALRGLARVQAMDVADDNHHYIVLSQRYAWMHAHALPAAHGVLLDHGCGGQPYRQFFAPRITRYIGAE